MAMASEYQRWQMAAKENGMAASSVSSESGGENQGVASA